MPAVAEKSGGVMEKTQKAYWPVVDWLLNHDGPAFVADIPKTVAGDKLLSSLNAAWIDGMVEFGRREFVTTGIPTPSSKREGSRVIIEPGMSWTGIRKNAHLALKDIVAEDAKLPKEVFEIDNVQGKDGNYSAQAVAVDAGLLRLQVRATDKCYAELAA